MKVERCLGKEKRRGPFRQTVHPLAFQGAPDSWSELQKWKGYSFASRMESGLPWGRSTWHILLVSVTINNPSFTQR